MTPVTQSILAFAGVAGLLTITPGLDTALVLRTAAVRGAKAAGAAGLGIGLGCLCWGLGAAFGITAILTASQLAFAALKYAGAAYLGWLGLKLLIAPRSRLDLEVATPEENAVWPNLRRGLLTNLLNPKVGIFYLSFLPQFIPAGVNPIGFSILLAALHVLLGCLWFAILILATLLLSRLLRRPAVIRALDRVTGLVFLAFGVRLALARR
jgi:threonine/homoserine/homoserine lactone efflux protein